MTRRVGKVLAVAALAVVAALPLPALAEGTFRFGFHFGDEWSDFPSGRITCLTDYEIRQSVAARGYSNIYLNVPNDGRVEVKASYDGWVYLLDFDYCRDRIIEAKPLRPAG
jgi:hypothetical protein